MPGVDPDPKPPDPVRLPDQDQHDASQHGGHVDTGVAVNIPLPPEPTDPEAEAAEEALLLGDLAPEAVRSNLVLSTKCRWKT